MTTTKNLFVFLSVFMISFLIFQENAYATITATKDSSGQTYTYRLSASTDTMTTTVMTGTGYSGIVLPASNTTIASLAVNGTGSTWTQNAAITLSSATVTLSNVTVNTTAKLTAKNLTINNTSTVSGSATNLSLTNTITNNGTLIFNAGTNNNSITGTGLINIDGTVTNVVIKGYLGTASSAISQIAINSSGNLTNSGYIYATNFAINSGGTLTTSANNLSVTNTITNNGTLTLNAGTNDNNITGSGTVNIQGTTALTNNASITAGTFTNTNTGGFVNNGTLTVNTTGTNSRALSGTGSLIINGTFTNTATYANLIQDNLTISTAGSLTTSAGDLSIANTIVNNGTLNLTAGTNVNTINGTGTVNIQGTSAVTNTASITAKTFTNTDTAGFINNGTLTVSTTGTNSKTLSGTGSLIVSGGTFTNSSVLSQTNLTINTGGTFITDARISSCSITNTIINNGNLTFTAGENKNNITGTGTLNITTNKVTNYSGTSITLNNFNNINSSFENNGILTVNATGTNSKAFSGSGSLIINGTFTNTASLLQSSLTIAEGGNLITNAETFTVTNGITNNGTLTFSGGTNNSTITGGIVAIKGTVTNKGSLGTDTDKLNSLNITTGTFTNDTGSIYANSMSITSVGCLITNASNLFVTNSITNSAYLTFTSGTNNNNITGTGSLSISGTVDNNSSITQKTLNITSSGNLLTDADNINITNAINNNGILTLTSGTNDNAITGTGTLNIQGSTSVINTASITAGNFTNTNSAGFVNNGSLTVTSVGTNSTALTGTGSLNINGTFLNSSSLTQKNITLSTSGYMSANATNLSVANKITNNGILTFTAGTNNNTITGTGTFNVQGSTTVTNTASITAGIFTNANTAGFINNGTLIVTSTGTNSKTLSGTGNLTVSGNFINDDILNQNTLIISSGAVLTNNDKITLNNLNINSNGMFISNTSSNLTILNSIVNNGRLEIDGGTLNCSILGNGAIVKKGSATLLLSTSSYFTGSIEINNGKIVTTVANTPGKIYGSAGTNSETMEFADNNTTVTLNEIDTTQYLTNFEKTGNSKINIVNNFKAKTASISGGIFSVNNLTSSKIFEVDSITFSNTGKLSGNANITGNVIMNGNSVLSPGNSIGETNISGNLNFNNNSSYELEIMQTNLKNSSGLADKITATGNINISSTASINLINKEGSKYFIPETFNILAGNSITGYFSNIDFTGYDVNDSNLRLRTSRIAFSTTVVNGNILQLTVKRKASTYSTATDLDLNENQSKVAELIDSVSTDPTSNIVDTLNTLESYYYYTNTYNTEAFKLILNEMIGSIYANSMMLPFFNSNTEYVYTRIKQRLDSDDQNNNAINTIWGQCYYNSAEVKTDTNSSGYSASLCGFLIGYDMLKTNSYTIGILTGYGTGSLKQNNDTNNMTEINLGLYAGYEDFKWQFKGLLSAGTDSYNTTRLNTKAANYSGLKTSLDFEAGYKIDLLSNINNQIISKPFGGLLFSYITQSSFEEKDLDIWNLKVNSMSNLIMQIRIGTGFEGKTQNFSWYGRFGLKQFLTGTDASVTASFVSSPDSDMNIKSAALSPTLLNAGIGGDYKLSQEWTVFSGIKTDIASNSNDYSFNLGIRYEFGVKNKYHLYDNSNLINKKTQEEPYTKQKFDNIPYLKAPQEKQIITQPKLEKQRGVVVINTDNADALLLQEHGLIKNIPTTNLSYTDKWTDNLKDLANTIKTYSDVSLILEGFSKGSATKEADKNLSEEYALFIAYTLKEKYGINLTIYVVGRGDQSDIADEKTTNKISSVNVSILKETN